MTACLLVAAAVAFLGTRGRNDVTASPDNVPADRGIVVAQTSPVSTVAGIQESLITFESGGKRIRLQKFVAPNAKLPGTQPPAFPRRPVVLILYGADGMLNHHDAMYTLTARSLATQGYMALLLNYFDRTDTQIADEPQIRRHFPAWLTTIRDAVGVAAQMTDADPTRIGMLGFSLGGYLSLSAAAQDPRITAVAEYFGGLPEIFKEHLTKMPPTLILHGDRDNIVSVEEARKIEKLYAERKFPYEAKIYPGQGHGFTGPAAIDAALRTLGFFQKYLVGEENGDK